MTDPAAPPPESNEVDGEAFEGRKVALPTMKSLFIEMCFGDTILATGTAFLAARTQTSHCALITNRHNVTGRRQDNGACISKTAGIPDAIAIHFHKNSAPTKEWISIRLPLYRPDGSPYWIEHPALGAEADVVAMNLTWGSDVFKMPYYLGGNTTLDQSGMLIDPSEPMSVIGFPFGLSLAGKFPVWATGFLAQDLTLIDPKRPVFLVDCRTRQGQSGSPVIAYRTTNVRRMEGDRVATSLVSPTTWEFMGIYSGRINSDSDLGTVWHASVVTEVLDAAEEDNQRRVAAQLKPNAGAPPVE